MEERIGAHGLTYAARSSTTPDLARVLELMLVVLEGRKHARSLEVSSLGYLILLHIAVTLTPIP